MLRRAAPVATVRDRGDIGSSPNNTLAGALVIEDIRSIARVTGATLHNAADVDFYRFTLTSGDAAANPRIRLRPQSLGSGIALEKIPTGSAGGYAKMHSALQAGQAPDLAQVEYQVIPEFLLDDGLMDLKPLGVADLPTPEEVFNAPRIGFKQAVTLVVGPSLIALGLSIGSGEWLLAPLAMAAGLVILRGDLLIVNYFRGSAEAGVYAVATQASLFLHMLPNVISTVFFPRSADARDETGQLTCRVTRTSSVSMVTGAGVSTGRRRPRAPVAHWSGLGSRGRPTRRSGTRGRALAK